MIHPSLRSLKLFRSPNLLPAAGEFHLHPRYRTPSELDATLAKVQASLDNFPSEKYASQIAVILSEWRAGLLESPPQAAAIEKVLADGFLGSSLRPVESRSVRSGPPIEVRRNQFAQHSSLRTNDFLSELRSSLAGFARLTTADLQITVIDATPSHSDRPPELLRTRVRYELVGTGNGFHLEQRVGSCDLEWGSTPSGEYRLRSWRALDEVQSRSYSPIYADITAAALARNDSYSAQLLHGADHWRTVLDGACGIDIYGHNGVAVGDIDDDGFDDLYVCQPGGLPNRLYRNRGDGTFEDVTDASGVGVLESTACALFADIDNDGRQDLIVVRSNEPMLFLNQGGGRFRQKPNAFQFANPPQGTFAGAAVADYDRDGWLDIYFCLYIYYQGADQYKYPSPYYAAENGPPNFMMRNHRDGTFRDVTRESGLDQNNTRYSFCCAWNDYNRDGWPDLYVVNDFGRKNLYRNNGDGTFTDVAGRLGVEDVGAGMSISCFDCDNDGAEDFYVGDMWTAAGERITIQPSFKKGAPDAVRDLYHKHAMGNSLFRNRGESFQDMTRAAGVGIGRWAWSGDAWDFDHDGFPDLYIANGMVSGSSRDDLNSFFWRQVVANSPEEARPSHDYEQGWTAINELIRSDGTWSGYERNVFYANNRDGTFSDISGAAGLDFVEDGRSFALCDLDHDGRQEVLLKNRNAPQLRILKNVMANLPPSIAFRLTGTKSNRDGIGSNVTIETTAGRQTRSLQAGSGFLSQHSKEVFFGVGGAQGPVRAEIRWPSGLVQKLNDLPLNHRIFVAEGSASPRTEPFLTGLSPATSVAPPFASSPSEADSLPTIAETWSVAPVPAPDFSLPDSDGNLQTLAGHRGKPLLLNFWVTGSPACEQDLAAFGERSGHWLDQGLQLLAVNLNEGSGDAAFQAAVRGQQPSLAILRGNEDVAAVYNILYRYLFDRHRDLSLPTSFLLNARGEIVKIYHGPANPSHIEQDFRNIPQTPAERIARALPFPGVTDTIEFGRNYLSFGSIYFQRGYFDQAEAAFQRALRDDPESPEGLYGLGSVYLNQQKTADARSCFERAVKLRTSYPDTLPNAWNNLGLLAAREGRTDEAITNFQEAIRLSPDHLVALDNLGNAFRQKKEWEQARQVFSRALAVNAADAEASYGLGMVFAQTGDNLRAEQYLLQAVKLRPAYAEALNNLGILYLRSERHDEAIANFEECIREAPAFDQSYLNLARVYAIEGLPDKARSVLLDLLKQHPDHAQGRQMLDQLPQ